MDFYICNHCKNIITFENASGVPVICCGEPMQKLVPGSVDASAEKHVPVVSVSGTTVTVHVGSAEHPMTEEHHIQWIILETNKGYQRRTLIPGQAPAATFVLAESEAPHAVYAYCNLHGLWQAYI